MADNDIHNINVTISRVEDTGPQIKIHDQNNRTYSFFKNKKDGGETEAFRNFQQFKAGDNALLIYKEVPYKDGTIKNVMTIRPATGQPEAAAATSTEQWRARSGAPGPDARQGRLGREYWEKREAKRESSILMQVAFKAAIAIQEAKIHAGEAEDRDWVYNTTLEFYDWLADHISEEGATQTQSHASRTAAEESRDDEIIF